MIERVVETLSTTCHAMGGGVDAVYGVGEDYLLTFGTAYNAWDFNTGDKVTLLFTDSATNYQTQIGAGYVTGKQFSYCMTYQNKVYGLAGGSVYCSALYEPTIWNDPNAAGNGFVTLSNWHGKSENLVAMSTYQGRIAFFSQNTTQIWQVDGDLNNWSLMQVLPNFGCVAALSVQNSGEMDVIFLSSTGIRSLRTRDAVLNAFVADIGSPVDSLVMPFITTDPNNPTVVAGAGACSVIDPTSGRYICFIPPRDIQKTLVYDGPNSGDVYPTGQPPGLTYVDVNATVGTNFCYMIVLGENEWRAQYNIGTGFPVYTITISKTVFVNGAIRFFSMAGGSPVTAKIYLISAQTPQAFVLSTYPSNQILAWSQYNMTDDFGDATSNGAAGAIFPQKFVVFQNTVITRDENCIYAYGRYMGNGNADTGTGYDYTQAVVSTPWLDLDSPGTRKQAKGIDTAFIGDWTFSVGMDQLNEQLDYVWKGTQPTFQLGSIEYSNEGTHFRMQAVSNRVSEPMSIGSLIFHYLMAGEK